MMSFSETAVSTASDVIDASQHFVVRRERTFRRKVLRLLTADTAAYKKALLCLVAVIIVMTGITVDAGATYKYTDDGWIEFSKEEFLQMLSPQRLSINRTYTTSAYTQLVSETYIGIGGVTSVYCLRSRESALSQAVKQSVTTQPVSIPGFYGVDTNGRTELSLIPTVYGIAGPGTTYWPRYGKYIPSNYYPGTYNAAVSGDPDNWAFSCNFSLDIHIAGVPSYGSGGLFYFGLLNNQSTAFRNVYLFKPTTLGKSHPIKLINCTSGSYMSTGLFASIYTTSGLHATINGDSNLSVTGAPPLTMNFGSNEVIIDGGTYKGSPAISGNNVTVKRGTITDLRGNSQCAIGTCRTLHKERSVTTMKIFTIIATLIIAIPLTLKLASFVIELVLSHFAWLEHLKALQTIQTIKDTGNASRSIYNKIQDKEKAQDVTSWAAQSGQYHPDSLRTSMCSRRKSHLPLPRPP